MNKILFFTDKEKQSLIDEINNQLKIKNHLLKVLYENKRHKLKDYERNKLANKYKDQIILLDNMKGCCNTVKNRDDIHRLNSIIEFYNKLQS
ncbi:hypothetical protein P9265_07570 [Schinkia azotoformans]|uniref:hypothetical protein n=1 Tax=Schinkia azotoformans TaxID=1454 RepID=UPI002E21F066|nr:hypothetical protein [Schinkia azotoformans]